MLPGDIILRNIRARSVVVDYALRTCQGFAGGVPVNHDIDDLLAIIKELEKRIMKLESREGAQRLVQHEDSWYWEHG